MKLQGDIIRSWKNFLKTTNLICIVDHGGRAGSNFLNCLFDQHKEVLSIQWLHYNYSYILDKFGKKKKLTSKDAKKFLCYNTYFKYLYNSPKNESHQTITKIGGDQYSFKKRKILRFYIDNIFSRKKKISRKELILLPYFCYAISIKKNLSSLKYILINDAISLRSEKIINGFSGCVVEQIILDFPKVKLVSLVRDPRAQYASSRHQSVNEFDNNYNIRIGNLFRIFANLFFENFKLESGPANLIWVLYQVEAARTIYRLKKKYRSKFLTLRNEDVNLDFINTMKRLTNCLNISFHNKWKHKNYVPTMMGSKWKGTGAYLDSFQTITDGILRNDPVRISKGIIGPNRYVTERWKKRIKKNELMLLEKAFEEEIKDLKYEFFSNAKDLSDIKVFFSHAIFPDIGEIPNFRWIRNGLKRKKGIFLNRVIYLIFFPFLFFLCRFKLFKYMLIKKKFKNVVC